MSPLPAERAAGAVELAELVERRTPHAKVYRRPDGGFRQVIGHLLHYEADDGTLRDVELDYRADGAGGYVMDRHVLVSRVGGARTAHAPFVEVAERRSGKGVRFSAPVLPATSGRRASYRASGLLWQYATRKSGLKLAAMVDARRGPQTYRFPYRLLGGAAALEPDAEGNLVSDAFAVPRAYAVGANGKTYPCGAWSASGGAASFGFDDSALPPEAYPYELDPSTTFAVAASLDDQHVQRIDTVYPPAKAVTRSTTATTVSTFRRHVSTATNPYQIRCGLLRWDTSSIPDDAAIVGASFAGVVVELESVDSRSLTMDWHAWNETDTDYSETAQTNALSGKAISTLTNLADNTIPLSNAAASVSKTGITRLRFHVSGGQPTGSNIVAFSGFDDTAAVLDPRLIVDYGLPVALSGVSSSASSATGALSRRRRLSGTSGSASSASGALRSQRGLSGTSGSASSATGAISSKKSLSGSSGSASSASGILFTGVLLIGSSGAASSASGALSSKKPLAGLSGSASSVVGIVSSRKSLSGLSGSVSSAAGMLYVAPTAVSQAFAANRGRRIARTLAGYFGPVDLQYRLYRSDKHATQIAEITDWAAGDISLGNDREAGWALSLDMRRTDQIDPWRDYVLAMAELAIGGDPDDLERYPLGLYRTARDEMLPAITYLEELELWELRMESQEAELAEWPPEAVYSVAAGTGVLLAVRRILNMLGWPDTTISFPPPSEDSPLGSIMVLDPFEDSGESNWLSFCNALLGSRSFYALKTDRWGKWFTEKIRDAADFPPDVHYGPDPLEPLIVGEIQEGRDTTRFANVVIAASQDTSQVPRVSATVINDDPDSPASVRNYGRRVYKRVERQSIGSAADAQAIARAELARSASFHRSPRIATLADPRRFQIRQTYRITDYSGDREILTEVPRWDVTSVSLPINHDGSQETMTHELGAVYPMETRVV